MDLSRLRELCERATPGPWEDQVTDAGEIIVDMGPDHMAYFGSMEGVCAECLNNTELVAKARTAMPLLVDIAIAAQGFLNDIRALLGDKVAMDILPPAVQSDLLAHHLEVMVAAVRAIEQT